jgi:hypothetical protein
LTEVRVEKGPAIPYQVLEAVAGIHPAVDPETGHFECHYSELRLGSVEVGGERLPAIIVGCLAVTVAVVREEELGEPVSAPVTVSGDWVEAGGARGPREMLRVYSAIASSTSGRVTLVRAKVNGSTLLAMVADFGEGGRVLVVPVECGSRGEEGGDGGIHM